MDRKIIWVASAMFLVACAALSVHHEELADDEFETHKERKGKICKFYKIYVHFLSSYIHRCVCKWH